jgi:hypothetical protein
VTESPVAISKATTKFTRIGISRRVAPLGTVPVGTIEAFADMVPWGAKWIGFLNDLFYDRSYIAGLGELSISVCA